MTSTPQLSLPTGFRWGVATSAYQIEGAAHEDGRGESIWDRFARTPGKVRNGETGEVACDHYHRYPKDVALMQGLGLNAYRFSIAWPRILPEGRGQVNVRGLDFYDRLIDALLEAGIEPFPTLYHWDLPQALEDRGGWLRRETADAFEEYAAAVVKRLGDRVKRWITVNEPWCIAWLGYAWGEHAPGRTDEGNAPVVGHNVLLAHGRGLRVIRSLSPRAEVGISPDLYAIMPASDSPEDMAAARIEDGWRNRWFLDPVFRGTYPEDVIESTRKGPEIAPGDMEAISAPIDFLGINYYSRTVVRAGAGGRPQYERPHNGEYTAINWEVYPDGLRDILLRVQRDYDPLAVYVTENGAAYIDVRSHDGSIRDPERIDYMARHLRAAAEAVAGGSKLRGYFVWSLLDNFEWARGYGNRFGIVYVDFQTLQRIPKSSYYWYRDFIAGQAPKASVA